MLSRFGVGIVEQTLLRVEFSKFQHILKRGLELADLLVHRDSLDRETLAGIGIAYCLEALSGFIALSQAGVEIANGISNCQILSVVLENLFVLRNSVLQFPLLNVFLRTVKSLLLVESEQRNKSTNPSPWSLQQ